MLIFIEKNLHNPENCLTFAPAFRENATATVAQLVEQRIRNAWVAGSSPASGSKRVSCVYTGWRLNQKDMRFCMNVC